MTSEEHPAAGEGEIEGEADPDADRTAEETADGRSAYINTGHYEVQVWGDPEDSLTEIVEATRDLAAVALEDVEDLNTRLDGDDHHYN